MKVYLFFLSFLICSNCYALNENLKKGCPKKLNEWNSWLQNITRNISKISTSSVEDELEQIDKYRELIITCQSNFITKTAASDTVITSLSACTEPSLSYLRDLKKEVYNHEVNLEYTAIPMEFQDKFFQEFVYDPNKLPKAIKYIESLNKDREKDNKILFALFRASQNSPGDKGSASRMLVYIPGNPKRYLSFVIGKKRNFENLKQISTPLLTPNVSVIATYRQSDGTSKTYFDDHTIVKDKGIFLRKSHHSIHNGSSCNSCHGGAPLLLSEVLPEYQEVANLINQKIKEETYDFPQYVGPLLGMNRKRSDKLLNYCLKQQTRINASEFEKLRLKLRSYMNCTSCHNGSTKEARKLFAYQVNISFNRILSGDMPRYVEYIQTSDSHGSRSDIFAPEIENVNLRLALLYCLEVEAEYIPEIAYEGTISEFLRPLSCAPIGDLNLNPIESRNDLIKKPNIFPRITSDKPSVDKKVAN